jgi:hypothetical protein
LKLVAIEQTMDTRQMIAMNRLHIQQSMKPKAVALYAANGLMIYRASRTMPYDLALL